MFEAEPLRLPDGGIDFDRLVQATEAVLHRVPRYRQKLRWIPFENHPIWVVEGLEGDRFAVISKIHHSMADGMAGADLLSILLRTKQDDEIPQMPPFTPRRAALPFQAVRQSSAFAREAENIRDGLRTRMRAMAETVGKVIRPPSETPLNQPIGSHRRFDWFTMELDEAKRIAKELGGFKRTNQASAADLVTQLGDWISPRLVSFGARALVQRRLPFNMVVTNVPGPQIPLFMLGARLTDLFPSVPITGRLGLGIALFSYDGKLYWGFNADWEQLPDLHGFIELTEFAFDDLRSAAGMERYSVRLLD